ncbi:ABC transporter permease [Dyella sp. 7MK23]|uniref:ABC transporter permease n=2 Tax=Dyella acidiphila TaxID=2775866 RepID=A0ABR9G9L1_9GAMM|nr:ABC transporter permease [Dyella acidiphila]
MPAPRWFNANTAWRMLGSSALSLVLTLAGLLAVTFVMSAFSPIDPALQQVGDHASAATYAQARHALGLDAPLPLRFAHYLIGLCHGDLGISTATGQAVAGELREVFPATLELSTIALLISAIAGVGLALLSARWPGSWVDSAIRVISLLGSSVPIFWLGLVALALFYAHWHWAGGPGRLDDAYEYTIDMPTGLVLLDSWRSGMPGAFASAIRHMLLPALLLASYVLGSIARLTRTSLLGELHQEYVTLARAKGAGPGGILLRHVLPNCLGPMLTVIALAYTNLLQGAVLTETVFARPGLGRYLTNALFYGDVPAILGATLVLGIVFILINGVTDMLVRLLDPRLR